jgi:CubicO group peptidase (beta-lactamase class C family)
MRAHSAIRRHSELDHLAREITTTGTAPVAACEAWYRVADHWRGGFGLSNGVNGVLQSECDEQPVFDLASLTKPVVALLTHHAIARGELERTQPLGGLLPEARGTRAEDVPLDALLAHRSGLSAHLELFSVWKARRCASRRRLLEEAANAEPAEQRGQAFPRSAVYSDLGYILLGAALEERYGMPLDEWVGKELAALGIEGLHSARQWRRSSPPVQFVPTEVVPWRGGLVQGLVHDENAWLLSGHGLSGHAGLFGTAHAVAHFGATVLDACEGRLGRPLQLAAIEASAPREGGTLCAGFDRRTPTDSSAGVVCSQSTFGHLGFTGTSFWCDPEARRVAVVLTNRVCPSRENVKIRRMRPMLHDALFTWIHERRELAARSFTL